MSEISESNQKKVAKQFSKLAIVDEKSIDISETYGPDTTKTENGKEKPELEFDGQDQRDDGELPPLPRGYNLPSYSIADLQEISENAHLNLKDFKIIQLAGKGGFGKVYQVCRQSDKRVFALKTMRKDMIIEMGQVSQLC